MLLGDPDPKVKKWTIEVPTFTQANREKLRNLIFGRKLKKKHYMCWRPKFGLKNNVEDTCGILQV